MRENMFDVIEVGPRAVNAEVTPELGIGFGKISASAVEEKQAEELAEQVRSYLVSVDASLPSSCIDGRPSIGLISGEVSEPRPSLAGGAAISGWLANELVSGSHLALDDVDVSYGAAAKKLEDNGVIVGMHCDQESFRKAFDGGKTGCGAADRAKEIVEVLSAESGFISQTVDALLGKDFNSETMKQIIEGAEIMRRKNRLSNWQGADMLRPYTDQGERTEILKAHPDETHGHHEKAVVINYVPNTTLDRDRLVNETGKQVFAIDMWYVRKVAEAMSGGRATKANKIMQAVTAYQVATYATLCDGSHRAIILK